MCPENLKPPFGGFFFEQALRSLTYYRPLWDVAGILVCGPISALGKADMCGANTDVC